MLVEALISEIPPGRLNSRNPDAVRLVKRGKEEHQTHDNNQTDSAPLDLSVAIKILLLLPPLFTSPCFSFLHHQVLSQLVAYILAVRKEVKIPSTYFPSFFLSFRIVYLKLINIIVVICLCTRVSNRLEDDLLRGTCRAGLFFVFLLKPFLSRTFNFSRSFFSPDLIFLSLSPNFFVVWNSMII